MPGLDDIEARGARENNLRDVSLDIAKPLSVREACEGKRFTPEVLEYPLREAGIADVLEMSVEEAGGFFAERPCARCSARWPTSTSATCASGSCHDPVGRRAPAHQAGHRGRPRQRGDRPRRAATGLHMDDVSRFVERGRTVIVIEHDLDVVAGADWVIDMGPGAGHDGGRVIFEGAPHALLDADGSLTGRHLAEHLRMVSTDVRSAVLSG